MSSFIGYTRLHWPHLSAVPFFTSSTFVLQFGQARISSNSASTAIVCSACSSFGLGLWVLGFGLLVSMSRTPEAESPQPEAVSIFRGLL